MTPDVALASCAVLPEPDPDAAPLAAALAATGLAVETLAWDDPAVDWSLPRLAVLRSTWNYYVDRDRFLAWAAQIPALVNPIEVVRWNTHKRYLLDLAGAGIATVPTVLVERGADVEVATLCAGLGWSDVVVKPAVSAASFLTHRLDPAAGDAPFRELVARRDALVQPFVESVADFGERSVIAIDGAITHSVRKSPRFGDQGESVTPAELEAPERDLAEAALAHVADRFGGPLLYARIDCVRDAGGLPLVAELELTEPSLFFDHGPEALARMVSGIKARL
jgi:hypothetical protein